MRPIELLILDDDRERREQLLAVLRQAGHRAVAAGDSTAAAEALGTGGSELLVLDLRRPDLDLARLSELLAPSVRSEPESLEAVERRQIAVALRYTEGNRRRAAHLLGISRSTLLHKLRRYGLAD
jgi:DNA-binding NtrC family response regulator